MRTEWPGLHVFLCRGGARRYTKEAEVMEMCKLQAFELQHAASLLRRAGPSSSRLVLCNAHSEPCGLVVAHAIGPVRALKSSPLATAGGTGPLNDPPKVPK